MRIRRRQGQKNFVPFLPRDATQNVVILQ